MITLQAGEVLVTVAAGDMVRWIVERHRRRAARQRAGQVDPFGPQDQFGHNHQPAYLPDRADLNRESLDGLGILRLPEGPDTGAAAPGAGCIDHGAGRYRPRTGEDPLPLRDQR